MEAKGKTKSLMAYLKIFQSKIASALGVLGNAIEHSCEFDHGGMVHPGTRRTVSKKSYINAPKRVLMQRYREDYIVLVQVLHMQPKMKG